MKSVNQRERGTAVVEAAIVLPVFLLILIGICEFGLVFHSYLTLQNGVREGARFAAIGSNASSVEQRVRDYTGSLNQGSLTINVSNAGGNRGSFVTVDSSYPVPLITPLIQGIVGDTDLALTAEASMRLE